MLPLHVRHVKHETLPTYLPTSLSPQNPQILIKQKKNRTIYNFGVDDEEEDNNDDDDDSGGSGGGGVRIENVDDGDGCGVNEGGGVVWWYDDDDGGDDDNDDDGGGIGGGIGGDYYHFILNRINTVHISQP